MELQLWLKKHSISYDSTALRKELLLICQANKQPAKYVLDEYVSKTTDHRIVRLPPYHCQYNPIEMIWSLTKRYFDTHVGRNNDFSLENTDKIWLEALESVTPEFWRSCCEHTERQILEDYASQVADETEPSYQIRIMCDDDDFVDDEDFEIMELRPEDVTVKSNDRSPSSSLALFNVKQTVRRVLFDSEMVEYRRSRQNLIILSTYALIFHRVNRILTRKRVMRFLVLLMSPPPFPYQIFQ